MLPCESAMAVDDPRSRACARIRSGRVEKSVASKSEAIVISAWLGEVRSECHTRYSKRRLAKGPADVVLRQCLAGAQPAPRPDLPRRKAGAHTDGAGVVTQGGAQGGAV